MKITEPTAAGGSHELLSFEVSNVTGTQQIPVESPPQLPVRIVTESISHEMALPGDVPWSLRDDGSSAYLDEDAAIGDQIQPGSRVTVVPRTHLGGGARHGG